jgi:pilus assembly protein CpaB
MSRNSRLALVLAVALGAAGAASLVVYRVVASIPVREVEVASMQAVVAAKPIPVGTMLTADHVKLVPWPSRNPVPGSFSAIDKVVNRGAIVEVAENEPLTESKLAPLGAGAGLSPTIPTGMRAISVRTNEVVGVAGFVIPGTRVDVLVTVRQGQAHSEPISRAVVSNVEVLTAGTRFDQEKAKADGKPIPTTVVTLLVTPDQAERISLAANEGQIALTLRNPLDVAETTTNGVRMATLLSTTAPPVVTKRTEGRRVVVKAPAPAPAPTPKTYTVETIRAAKRTEEAVQ